MTRSTTASVPVIVIALVLGLAATAASAEDFTLSSTAFKEGGTLAKAQINAKANCGSGGDLSPALAWTGAPTGTKSFAVTLFDPDARGGKGWWHWALYDLTPGTHALPEGASKGDDLPEGAHQAKSSFGTPGYGGACPPPGDPPHHYVFTLWAVGDETLPFDTGSTDAEVGAWLADHSLGKATTTARYGRP